VLSVAVGGGSTAPKPWRRRESIGPYRLVKLIGLGGMSRVYLGHRDDDPLRLPVAIKVAEDEFEPDVTHFRSERDILAALDHPNIARLLDSGTTAEGLPYLVLEYVEGEPVGTHCDERWLGIDERLRIFGTICAAVHHAHQRRIVHGDIKPANVLVTPDGTAKLLDFGIAERLEPCAPPSALPLATRRTRPLTPEYASPEQLRGEPLTPASDVYSLGVLLYELLTGCRPWSLEGQASDFERMVLDVEPELPSKAALWPARRARASAETRSRDRGTTPERLSRSLEGALDAVVLKALGKTPARRYASSAQVAEAVYRSADELVPASRRTISNRLLTFVARTATASTEPVFSETARLDRTRVLSGVPPGSRSRR
jgi:eukaryotic-like serine/threonine-protein kinase